MSNRTFSLIGLALLALGVIGLCACSALPVTQGTLDDVMADQATAADAADSGNVLRTVLSGLSAFGGAVLLAIGRLKAHDKAPFQGNVAGRTVSATEDEIVAVVEASRNGGSAKPSA